MHHLLTIKLFSFKRLVICLSLTGLFLVLSCNNSNDKKTKTKSEATFSQNTPKGMIWVPEKTFLQGAKEGDKYAMAREKPAHLVKVDGFYIDIHEVTNKQFKAFVDATGYKTVAERPISWAEIKEQVPPGTLKPHDSLLQPGSLIFNKEVQGNVNMNNYFQWWTWKIGANWKHPQGPESNIEGKDNYPVVHVTYEDAMAYCEWANRRLPTEAEWEAAAQGENRDAIYTWGNDADLLTEKANTWQGQFPILNEGKDGFEFVSPIKSFEPNSYGIYDMLGNVWEITSDFFDADYYKKIRYDGILENPKGSDISYNLNKLLQKEYVIKGGSFLCHASYCASFRISAKMGMTFDSSSDHTGFRTVVTEEMLERENSNE
jgi:formylglycine-generating enzyme required for sulfatase activity